MPVKVKDIKDDAVIEIKVNKTFYIMVKSLSRWLVDQMELEKPEDLKQIMNKKFESLTEVEKSFYTTALLLAEIEISANNQDKLEEKEILLEGDEGYVAPILPSED